MAKLALGVIETIGLVAATVAADAAVKSANVKLIGYELTKGDGLVTVKIEGDVGAVKAGIDSAKAAASKIGTVYSTLVIARASEGLDNIILSSDTVGLEQPEKKVKKEEAKEKNSKEEIKQEEIKEESKEKVTEEEIKKDETKEEVKEEPKKEEIKKEEVKEEVKKEEPAEKKKKKPPSK